jgi:uncharacterized iron-regulated membrane protein
MKLRPVIFWSHLVVGVIAGLVIFMMSVTGVLLTYERQIVSWVENSYLTGDSGDADILPADALFTIAQRAAPDAEQITLTYNSDPDSVLHVSAGRNRNMLVDPYHGEVLHDGETAVEKFFATTMYIHRWFALSGESRAIGRAITGYSNLLFLFLLCTGIYLWLPRVWSRAMLKARLFFNPKAKSGQARDFNWHHVFAIWSVIPLFFLITTASVFYFPWANAMVYGAFGEEVPDRRGGGNSPDVALATAAPMPREALLQLAINEAESRGVGDWETLSMQVSNSPQSSASFRIDRSAGGQPAKVYNLEMNTADGAVTSWTTFADKSPGTRARFNIRFLHTGEVFGFLGQTVAGLVSLAACFLVWTGLALAWRRLVRPLFLRTVRT